MRKTPLFLLVALVLAGCSSVPDEDEAVRVDSYARADAGAFKTFRLLSGSALHPQNSLVFQDMAAAMLPSLTSAGLTVWKDSDSVPPDLLVILDWMPPKTRETTSTASVPVIGTTGGGQTTHNSTSVVNGHLIRTTGSSYTAPTLAIIGSREQTKTTLLTYGGISLVAYESTPILAQKDQLDQLAKLEVWSLSVSHVSEQPRIDPRIAYPEYLRAAKAYIGRSSGGQLLLPLAEFAH